MKITCEECKGTGLEMPLCDGPCPVCNGSGQVERVFAKANNSLKPLPMNEDGVLVQQLLDKEYLSEWETDFCISVEKQVRQGRALTEKQRNKIREIV